MTSNIAKAGLIGLAYGGIMLMTATDAPHPRVDPSAKAAAKQADSAAKALRGHRDAVGAAEAAVTLAPRVAGYRVLLGQSYLQGGRFASARQAFGDALALDGGNGKAALNLALTEIATGDWQAAQRTLQAHADVIPAGDRGLALALAGDTAGGVAVLTDVARSPEASAKIRQNLALAYALGGQWELARVIAAADMSPADVDGRMQQWAAFAQPQAASDQVASLLGVRAVADAGQPVALALNAPVAAPVQVAAAPVADAPVSVAVAPVVPAAVRVAVAAIPAVTFAPPKEVVQALPAQLIPRADGPAKVALAKPARMRAASISPAGGQWYVQLGAYDNAGVARDGWARAQRRFAGFGGKTPNGVAIKTAGATFYRLSVGGFARADADRACRAYRARGGDCFVRMGAGDQVAHWVRSGVQLASR